MKLLFNNNTIANEEILDGSKFLGWYPQQTADGGIVLTVIDPDEFLNEEHAYSVIITKEDIDKLKQLGYL